MAASTSHTIRSGSALDVEYRKRPFHPSNNQTVAVAGRVASKGIEAALAIRPVDRWKFWTNVAFVKARYLDFQLVDSVQLGLVDSFARPGGNATGVNMLITAVEAKRLGLLHEFAPFATRIAILEPISKLLVRLQSAINVR